MANSDGFVRFVLDQLEPLDVSARKMFGEAGLYSGPVFFGIVAGDVLYLRVGDSNRAAFEAVDSTPFSPFEERPASRKYFSVPVDVLESPDLVKWARASIAAAQEGSATRPAAAPASRRTPRRSTAASSRGRRRR